jgi:hypothetical protein
MTNILFCSSMLSPREVEPDYADEHAAAKAAGFSVGLVDHSLVTSGEARNALRGARNLTGSAIYRGWMLKPREYEVLHAELASRGVVLVNDSAAYRFCHYLPESYAAIEGRTPRTVWMPLTGTLDIDAIMQLLRPFAEGALVLKDYVKSQKHYWSEACFIPCASDRVAVERVVRRFLELQGPDLNEGLVFREFVPLRIVGRHERSGMPLSAEVRTFWYDRQLVLAEGYWHGFENLSAEVPLALFADVVARVPSRFFVMDLALREDGVWTVVELGDGQVSGLQDPGSAPAFYAKLAQLSGVPASEDRAP